MLVKCYVIEPSCTEKFENSVTFSYENVENFLRRFYDGNPNIDKILKDCKKSLKKNGIYDDLFIKVLKANYID